MALKITLKPKERIILAGAVVANANSRSCVLVVENDVTVLRQKDIMSEKDAQSPCRRIYFTIQLMYIDKANLTTYHENYWKLVQDLLKAAPSMTVFIDQISEQILNGRHYRALKLAGKLIEKEQEVIRHV
jgi:flagellar protein FlbT